MTKTLPFQLGPTSNIGPIEAALPDWVPEIAITYLNHTSLGIPIRQIAREKGCHASTVLRQVRKLEALRDDPLVDTALESVERDFLTKSNPEPDPMKTTKSENRTRVEAKRILRRLCENNTYLLVANNLDKAVVFKNTGAQTPKKIASTDREFADRIALQEWISGTQVGTVGRYKITSVGRAALKRMLVEDGEADLASDNAFQDQHRIYELRKLADSNGEVQHIRFNLAESPLSQLGRRRGQNGVAFLSSDLVEAGERLREDFELAQMGQRVTQNWDSFLTSGSRGSLNTNSSAEGPAAARDRVSNALKALGPGLEDIALKVCCYLNGLEKAEKRLGWSARSGKVVLRIALQRLANHYGIAPAVETKQVG